MPYQAKSGTYEVASKLGHVSLVESPIIRESLKSFEVFGVDRQTQPIPKELQHRLDTRGVSAPRFMIAVDGSYSEVARDERYPSTRIGYVQVAGVLVNLDALIAESGHPLVDPSAVEEASRDALIPMVLPGSNVKLPGTSSTKESWRQWINRVFGEYQLEDRSLLRVLKAVLLDRRDSSGRVILQRCSSEECPATEIPVDDTGTPCPECGSTLFPTDCLRLHEEVTEYQSNLTAMGRLMTVLEHLAVAGYLDFFSENGPHVLSSISFIVDGPLALHGPQAWLHRHLHSLILRTRSSLKACGLGEPTIVGLEKSGQFVEHAQIIAPLLEPSTLLALSEDYIFDRILVSRPRSGKAYGADDFYGQRFIYKTTDGRVYVFWVPLPAKGLRDAHDPDHYPDLTRAVVLLESIGTRLYQDAVMPIALAHSAASIPLKTGTRVLKLLSQQFLQG